MRITVDIDVTPKPGQSQEDADNEMMLLVRQYLTLPEHPLMSDYGPDAWGGWTGPWVAGISVNRVAG